MSTQPNPDPTPKEITERAAEIRAGWSATEERRRYRHDERYSIQAIVSADDNDQVCDSEDC
jgi:hypothetical protein